MSLSTPVNLIAVQAQGLKTAAPRLKTLYQPPEFLGADKLTPDRAPPQKTAMTPPTERPEGKTADKNDNAPGRNPAWREAPLAEMSKRAYERPGSRLDIRI